MRASSRNVRPARAIQEGQLPKIGFRGPPGPPELLRNRLVVRVKGRKNRHEALDDGVGQWPISYEPSSGRGADETDEQTVAIMTGIVTGVLAAFQHVSPVLCRVVTLYLAT